MRTATLLKIPDLSFKLPRARRLVNKLLSERFVQRCILPGLMLVILNIKLWIAFQYRIAIWDAYVYLLNARRFLVGYDPYTFFEILRPPLVPYIISLLWKLFGENYYIAAAVQPIFTVMAAYVLFLLVRRMFGFKPAIVASLFLLVIPEMFLTTNQILAHGVGLLFIVISVFFLWRAINDGPEYYPIAGGALALATLTRYPTLVSIVMFLAVLLADNFSSIRRLRKGLRNLRALSWPSLGILFLILPWVPWLLWNYESVGGNPFASLQYGFLTGVEQEGAYDPTTWYFYLERIPSYLGVPATLLLFAGLADKRILKEKAKLILVVWTLLFFVFHTIIPNRQMRFYIEWTPPLATFVGLGVAKILDNSRHRTKIIVWTLIALWLSATLGRAVNLSLSDVPRQEGFIRSYDEFTQVVGWVVSNTKHSDIGATDVGPYLSYNTNRLFYDMTWINLESKARGVTANQFMKGLEVRIVVVRSDYAEILKLNQDPELVLIKSFPSFMIFQLV